MKRRKKTLMEMKPHMSRSKNLVSMFLSTRNLPSRGNWIQHPTMGRLGLWTAKVYSDLRGTMIFYEH